MVWNITKKIILSRANLFIPFYLNKGGGMFFNRFLRHRVQLHWFLGKYILHALSLDVRSFWKRISKLKIRSRYCTVAACCAPFMGIPQSNFVCPGFIYFCFGSRHAATVHPCHPLLQHQVGSLSSNLYSNGLQPIHELDHLLQKPLSFVEIRGTSPYESCKRRSKHWGWPTRNP